MSHDPLCEWSTPCIHGESQQHSRDTENLAVPDATYCWICGADCTCDLIAKARESERANVTAEFMSNHGGRWEYEAGVAAGRAEALGIRVREVMPYVNGYFDGQDHMLATCIAVVEEMPHRLEDLNRHEVLAALRSLQEKP